MMRYLWACLAAAVVAQPASANFGIFHRHTGVARVSYYYVPLPYYVPGVICPPPVIEQGPPTPPPLVHPLPSQPLPAAPVAAPQQAAPQSAPASPAEQLPPLPVMGPVQPQEATARKIDEPYFKVYTNARGDRSGRSERKSATFWNLTDAALTLKIDGQNQVVSAKSSQTVQVPGEFAWRVEGREPEVGSIRADESGVTIVIRR
jgi:hypothetical protein